MENYSCLLWIEYNPTDCKCQVDLQSIGLSLLKLNKEQPLKLYALTGEYTNESN